MPRPKETNKEAIKLAISEHLALHGPTGWPDLMAKYPDTSRATFFRYVKEVREGIEAAAAARPGVDLKAVQKRIRAQVQAPDQTARRLKAQLPATPSPAVIAGLGPAVEEVFNFMGTFNQIVRDANMMRQAAVAENADGTERLKNPMLMDRSVGRRLDLIETWLRAQDLVWNFERMQELYHLILEEVGKADPDTQQAILSRIRTLNNQRGMTIDAELS
jgi:predicted flap endonuclease-1-like 5' DNA nuclease